MRHSIIWGICALVTTGSACALRAGAPSGEDLLGRCNQAYKSLSTYQGTTLVTAVGTTAAGQPVTSSSSAQVWFRKPGHIRVEATATGPRAGTYAFVSDGTSTWRKSSAHPDWERTAGADMAIQAFSMYGGPWAIGSPLLGTNGSGHLKLKGVTTGRYSGRTVYRVDLERPTASVQYWIDGSTYLLTRVHIHLRNLDTTETYTDVKVNPSIPADRFTP